MTVAPAFSKCSITLVAWLNVTIHVAALSLAAWGMRPGTPLVPLADRLAYLAGHPVGWSLGWGAWMCCVPALIAFFALVAKRLRDQTDLARLAVVVAVVGGGIDLCCDAVYIIVFPMLAAHDPRPDTLFQAVERGCGAVSLAVANGLYTTAALLLTLSLRGRPGFDRWTIATGYGVGVCGYLLAAAAFTGVPWHAEWATGPTIGLFCLWTLLVARSVGSGRINPSTTNWAQQ
jgi:hypothetical protein